MIILLVATLIIVLTLLVNPLAHQEKTFLSPSLKSVRCLQTRVSVDRLLLFSFVLSAIALGAKIYFEFSNGISLLSYIDNIDNSAILHRSGKDSKLQILAQSLPIGGMLVWYYWFKVSNKIIFKTIALLPAFTPLIVGV